MSLFQVKFTREAFSPILLSVLVRGYLPACVGKVVCDGECFDLVSKLILLVHASHHITSPNQHSSYLQTLLTNYFLSKLSHMLFITLLS